MEAEKEIRKGNDGKEVTGSMSRYEGRATSMHSGMQRCNIRECHTVILHIFVMPIFDCSRFKIYKAK